MTEHPQESHPEPETIRWRRWYAAVLIWHGIVILLLYLLTRTFHP